MCEALRSGLRSRDLRIFLPEDKDHQEQREDEDESQEAMRRDRVLFDKN
jgi:hypothetical protein